MASRLSPGDTRGSRVFLTSRPVAATAAVGYVLLLQYVYVVYVAPDFAYLQYGYRTPDPLGQLPLRPAPGLDRDREQALPGRRQHYEAIAKGLRPVYTAPTEAAAMERFLEFCETWGERYPAIVRLWENASAEFVPFLGFDVEIRLERSTNARSFFDGESPAGCPRDGELDLT